MDRYEMSQVIEIDDDEFPTHGHTFVAFRGSDGHVHLYCSCSRVAYPAE